MTSFAAHDCGVLQTFQPPGQISLPVNPVTQNYYENTFCSYLITADIGMVSIYDVQSEEPTSLILTICGICICAC